MLWDPKKDRSQVSLSLLAAADYLEKHGWCQYIMEDSKGRTCILGAILLASKKRSVLNSPVELALVEYLNDSVVSWNDAEGRTQKQAIEMLRTAAQHL